MGDEYLVGERISRKDGAEGGWVRRIFRGNVSVALRAWIAPTPSGEELDKLVHWEGIYVGWSVVALLRRISSDSTQLGSASRSGHGVRGVTRR